MTDDDKALVERLRDFVIAEDIDLAADRIEAISARLAEADALIELQNQDIGRLREAFKRPKAWLVSDGETYGVTVFEPRPKDHPYCEIIPLYSAALGGTDD